MAAVTVKLATPAASPLHSTTLTTISIPPSVPPPNASSTRHQPTSLKARAPRPSASEATSIQPTTSSRLAATTNPPAWMSHRRRTYDPSYVEVAARSHGGGGVGWKLNTCTNGYHQTVPPTDASQIHPPYQRRVPGFHMMAA